MLRSITKSSNELQRAADAVSQMAESAKIGTDNVYNDGHCRYYYRSNDYWFNMRGYLWQSDKNETKTIICKEE